MRYICEFVGGANGVQRIDLEIAEKMTDKRSRCWAKERAAGRLCPREELDNRPVFKGFLGPMWDGLRYGNEYEFQTTPAERETIEPVAILRYETQEVYDLLSH